MPVDETTQFVQEEIQVCQRPISILSELMLLKRLTYLPSIGNIFWIWLIFVSVGEGCQWEGEQILWHVPNSLQVEHPNDFPDGASVLPFNFERCSSVSEMCRSDNFFFYLWRYALLAHVARVSGDRGTASSYLDRAIKLYASVLDNAGQDTSNYSPPFFFPFAFRN